MERTNEAWLAELRTGHPQQAEAMEDLRRYLKRGVLGYLRTRSDLNSLAEAELQQMSEDFTQDALLKIHDNLDTFKGQSKFTTWASKIAANHTISELRRAKWRDISLDAITEAGTSLQEILSVDSTPGDDPDTKMERQHVWQVISDVINNDLTERQREALVAARVQNIPITKVAELLETNANNVYKLLHDARTKLKRQLDARGWEAQYILNLFSERGGS